MGNLVSLKNVSKSFYGSFSDTVNIKSLTKNDFLIEKVFVIEDGLPQEYFTLSKIIDYKYFLEGSEEIILLKGLTLNKDGEKEVFLIKISLNEKQDKYFYPDNLILSLFEEKELERIRDLK